LDRTAIAVAALQFQVKNWKLLDLQRQIRRVELVELVELDEHKELSNQVEETHETPCICAVASRRHFYVYMYSVLLLSSFRLSFYVSVGALRIFREYMTLNGSNLEK
jgi:hypothetical protein